MGEFENGKMRIGSSATGRGGVTHLVNPDPRYSDTDRWDAPKPWCRPGYINMSNRAMAVKDEDPVTCRVCLLLQASQPAPTEGRHKK